MYFVTVLYSYNAMQLGNYAECFSSIYVNDLENFSNVEPF